MFRGQEEFRLHLAAKSPQHTPPSATTSSEAEDGFIRLDASDANQSSTTVVPQLLEEEQQQNQQQLLQLLLEEQDRRFEQLLQKQEHRLKEAFSSQIAVLVATINTLMQRAAARVDVGVQRSQLEGTTAGALADSCLSGPDCASTQLHVISGVPTCNTADSASLSGLPMGHDASQGAPALVSAQVSLYSICAQEGVAPVPLPPSQPPRAQSQPTTSMPASDHASTEVHAISGAPTNNDADSDSLSGLAPGDAALKAAPALPSTQAPQHSTSAETGIAVTPLSPLQPPRAQSQATTSLPASDHVSTEAHIISGASTLNTAASGSLSDLPTGDDALEAAPALLSAQAPQCSTPAEDGVVVTCLPPSQPPRAQSQARTTIEAPTSPVQSLTRYSTPPIPIPKRLGAQVHKSSWRSGRFQPIASLEGSSPRISAFQLGLSGNDVKSSSDSNTDSNTDRDTDWDIGRDTHSEDEDDWLPISSRQLDSSPEESDSEGSGSAWVSSLARNNRKKGVSGLSGLSLRPESAAAPRPGARAIGGQLAAARARTPAAALTALRPRSTASLRTVRPAAALTAVATAASLRALRPASTATAAPTAVAPSDFLIAAAPAVSAEALAEALTAALCTSAPADALSAGRPAATTALSPEQLESAQALQADNGQLADAVEVVAEVDSEETMPVQAAEADVVQPAADADKLVADVAEADTVHAVKGHSAEAGFDNAAADGKVADGKVAEASVAEADAAQPANADSTEAVLSAASDALTISMDLAHQADSAALLQVIDGDEQFVTSEGQVFPTGSDSAEEKGIHWGSHLALGGESTELPAAAHQVAAAQSATPKEGVHSAAPLPVDSGSTQPIAAAEQFADVQTATSRRSLSFKQGEDSSEEDSDADDDYLSSFSWEAAPFTSKAASSPEPAAVAASNEAAAPVTQKPAIGSGPGAEPMQPAMEGASQLDGVMFGTMTAADLLGVQGGHHQGPAAAASPTAPAAAPAVIAASGSAAAGSTAVAASEADVVAMHSAVASLGMSEDRSDVAAAAAAAAAAGTAAGNVPVSQPTDNLAAVSHGVEEDCKEDEEEEAQVNTSLGYTAFVTDSLLGRMEQQASSNGADITPLDVRDHMDLVDMGGHDNQAWYNYALLEGVNEQLAAAKRKMQPPAPAMQQLTPLRRPPSTPRAIACAVHDDIMRSVSLAEASMPDGFKHSRLLAQEAEDHQKSVEEGTARTEASLKMAIADSIFDDLIGDTAAAFLDAHGLQEPPSE